MQTISRNYCIFGIKIIQLNYEKYYQFKVVDGKVLKTIDGSFTCTSHEEVNTNIIFHSCNILHDSIILIRYSDTDILVIILGNMVNLSNSCNIWIGFGTANHQRIIDVTNLDQQLGNSICNALPGQHAFSGCDFIAAF